MTNYTRRQKVVLAFKYNGEALVDLPDWLQNYNHNEPDAFGNDKVGVSFTRDLLIPTDGGSQKVVNGQWVTLDNGKLYYYRNDNDFFDVYEEVGDNFGTEPPVSE